MIRLLVPLSAYFVATCALAGATADGRAVYLQVCRACHATGVAGAPVVGDRKAWAPRIASGIDHLEASAIRGKGGMPPKGGQPGLTNTQIRLAIEFMIAQTQ